jgi:hypothetical protein
MIGPILHEMRPGVLGTKLIPIYVYYKMRLDNPFIFDLNLRIRMYKYFKDSLDAISLRIIWAFALCLVRQHGRFLEGVHPRPGGEYE